MGKYDPLGLYLRSQQGNRVTLGFEEISAMVGGLPPSAYEHQAWWANSRSHPNAAAWLDAGWKVDSHDLRCRWVTLHRVAVSAAPTAHQGTSTLHPAESRLGPWRRPSPPKPDVPGRVAALIREFEPLLDYYDAALPFDRSGQYGNHRRTIDLRYQAGSVGAAVTDDRFLRDLYETLQTWGIGRRASRLVVYSDFVVELRRWSQALSQLDRTTIDAPDLDPSTIGQRLWELITGMAVVGNQARLVALSKTIHHLLPDLLPPIDRTYTQEFFGFYPVDFQEHQQQTFIAIWRWFVDIARAVQPARFVGSGWRTSRTKVIDNAVVAYIHRGHRVS